MEYKILSSSSIHFLMFEVNDNIKLGWEPIGGIAIEVISYGQSEAIYERINFLTK